MNCTISNTTGVSVNTVSAPTGTAVTTLPTLATNNSYFNVYVNGVHIERLDDTIYK
ncbi:DUF4183 domain-containing protein [Escherichia sp. R-CC3]